MTSRPLRVEESLNADLEIHPFAWRGVSTSSHPTALASQVAWITGESQISRESKFAFAQLESFICVFFFQYNHSKLKSLAQQTIEKIPLSLDNYAAVLREVFMGIP
jgi:hypothetical protein